jgi:hypothetical protein
MGSVMDETFCDPGTAGKPAIPGAVNYKSAERRVMRLRTCEGQASLAAIAAFHPVVAIH